MKLSFKSWTDYHHQIYRIYHGIIALSLVPFFLVFLEFEVAALKKSIVPEWLGIFVLILFIPLIVFLNWRIWKSNEFSYAIETDMTLREKLIEFRRVEIKKYWWMELLSVLSLMGLWLTANYLFVIAYFVLLAQFSFLRPSEDRLIRMMKLTKGDRKSLHESQVIE